MPENRKLEKNKIDANDVIHDYGESADGDDQGAQTKMEWYEQAKQDTTAPPEAVVTVGDIDAVWDQADAGEETVGGTRPTPDQDIVDEIGRAVGVHHEDAELLHMSKELKRRDERRWGLHTASSENFQERRQNFDIPTAPPKAEGESTRSEASNKRQKPKAA
jgi:Family of unknown function (DUF6335)